MSESAHFCMIKLMKQDLHLRLQRLRRGSSCGHLSLPLQSCPKDTADEKKGSGDEHQRAVEEGRCLFVVGVPPLWSISQIEDFFHYHGNIESVYLREAELIDQLPATGCHRAQHLHHVLIAAQGSSCRKARTGGQHMSILTRQRVPPTPHWCVTGVALKSRLTLPHSDLFRKGLRWSTGRRSITSAAASSTRQRGRGRGSRIAQIDFFFPVVLAVRQAPRLTRED